MGAKHVIVLPNLSTYYDKDMAHLFILLLLQCISRMAWEMVERTTIKKGNHEWLKETIIINEWK
jgi:hypothetical protein